MVAEREYTPLAEELITTSCQRQGIRPDQLTIHADRGAVMVASTLVQLLTDLGITPSHSRPHVPDDNPFSEAQFKTMKYHPTFPQRFGSLADARRWARIFFHWYNTMHYHSALGLLTPATVHYGLAEQYQQQRQQVLQTAYAAHPERFVNGQPKVMPLPQAVWINPPKENVFNVKPSLNSIIELSQSH